MNPDANILQLIMDEMNARAQKERAQSQLTLGALIALLEDEEDDSLPVRGLGALHSYRGYYSDLAFEPTTSIVTVHDVLTEARSAMGRTFEGYKGGDYLMGEHTPLWVSQYGTPSGYKLITLTREGDLLVPVTEFEEWDFDKEEEEERSGNTEG